MTLDEFIEAEKKRLEDFRLYWEAGREEDPHGFPDLSDQDFYERFLFFTERAVEEADEASSEDDEDD